MTVHEPMTVVAHATWARVAQPPAWLGGNDSVLPEATLLSTRARGRASLVTRVFAQVLAQVTHDKPDARSTLPMIFGSRYGEMATLEVLLRMANEADGALSPARFQSSVHNAAAGQLSIALNNPTFSTCIAGGSATVAACLEEAQAWLATQGGDVLVLLADEPVPLTLGGVAHGYPLGIALWLRATATTTRAMPTLQLHHVAPVKFATDTPQLPDAWLTGNPLARGLALMQLLSERRGGQVQLTPEGERAVWAQIEVTQ